ncbi:FtsK/SpoIIIE domain-containing protein [Frankia sp. AgB32]|uniref:FtsK/SpoIIIE domain-containing protein n=1 Tax=Frankia sp. AgB32 TaxID=631119 RepID=UPI00200F44A0|nr:FtsK/SpoIIIE domain-containing protein [Frankia sp. AgB32]MCK9897677.1 cell division protein FtsK [Frankia sp. AgB32]
MRIAVDGTWDVLPGPHAEVVRPAQGAAADVASILVRSPALTLRLQPPQPAVTPELRAATTPGWLEVNRPPRLRAPRETCAFHLPVPPTRPRATPVPVLATLLPLLAAAGLAVALGSATLLLFGLLGPVNLVASVVSTRRSDRRTLRAERIRHQQLSADVRHAAELALRTEHDQQHADHPDPAGLFISAWQRDAGLWRSRRGDEDYLRLRVGTATQPTAIEISPTAPGQQANRLSANVPAVISLVDHGVIGVAAPGDAARALGHWLVIQAAVQHGPRDLAICVLAADPQRAVAWRWIRWLPHCRRVSSAVAWFAADPASLSACVAELRAMIDDRKDQRSRNAAPEPDVLVVLDGARTLRSRPGMTAVLEAGPAVGIHVLCLESAVRDLPAECRAVVEPAGRHLAMRQDRGPAVEGISPDLVGPAGSHRSPSGLVGSARWCESVARALAPLRDPGGDDSALPVSVPLSEIICLDRPTSAAVGRRWQTAQGTPAAAGERPVPIGVANGRPFHLSLVRDGPHGLIAGTTGSGKSELLQTMIIAHAMTYRPDEMVFVLVDYKGGSAFAECAALPHTVGLVTDLDPHLVRRALVSLSAELRRREELLARFQAKDLEALALQSRPPGTVPPRLLLVVDEFASLARELPEFVAGLVGLAQRGRSLGLHLLLATQRPSGVVSPEIRANTNLRIALRVTDTAESEDIVGRPDAALLSTATPGRAVLRTGPDRVSVVQTGWVGGPAPTANIEATAPPPEVIPLPWPDQTTGWTPGNEAPTDSARETELTALVHAVRGAAAALHVPAQRRPWLSPLPDQISVLDSPYRQTPGSLPAVPIGLADHCDLQTQRPFTFDVVDGGHLLVVGASRSGRSTALRTVAGAIAAALSPQDVHIYGLDCGGDALAALTALPHTGALVGRDDVERVSRLLARLTSTVEGRRRQFAADAAADLREARRSDGAAGLPYLVLLVDGFEGFLAEFEDLAGGDLVESLLRLLREGPAAGLRVVLSADRRALTGRVASLIEERLVLRMADQADYALAGLTTADMPERLPAGRGMAIGGRFPNPVEVQLGLLDAEPSGQAQTAALRAVGRYAAAQVTAADPRWADHRPFRIERLPERVDHSRMVRTRGRRAVSGSAGSDRRVALGLGGDELDVIEINLTEAPGFVIGGPPRAGRSSTLLTIALSLLAAGEPVIAVTPRASAMRSLLGHPGVTFLDADLNRPGATGSGRATPLLPDGVPWPPPDPRSWLGQQAGPRPSVVLVDDAELIGEPAATTLADHWRQARDTGGALVLAGHTEELLLHYRGFAVDVRREGHGLLLSPRRTTDGDLLGVQLSRGGAAAQPPGRGVIVRHGSVTPVQVVCPARQPLPCSDRPSPPRESHENGHHPGGDAGRRPDESAPTRSAAYGHEPRQPRQHPGGSAALGGPESPGLPRPDLAGRPARAHHAARQPHRARPRHRRDQQEDRRGGELMTAPHTARTDSPHQPRQGAHHDLVRSHRTQHA